MSTSEHQFSLVLQRAGRVNADHVEEIDPEDLDFWEEAKDLLRVHQFVHAGSEINVVVDWSNLVAHLKLRRDLLPSVRQGKPADPHWFEKLGKPINLPCNVSVTGESEYASRSWYPHFFLELALHEAFIKANLSLPGSLDFYPLSVHGGSLSEPLEPRLSAFYFDFAWIETKRGNWPSLQRLPLEQVSRWYQALGIGIKQRADSGTERAIFSLYHLSRKDSDIESLIWLFHGLEALLSTRVGQNLSGIVRRASLLLEMDDKRRSYLGKKLRELYDLRSSFVHGGYGVPHPMRSEIVDQRLDDDYYAVLDANCVGVALLCALLQEFIRRDFSEIHFSERMEGVHAFAPRAV